MLLVSWNVTTPCVHRKITGPKPSSSISSLLSLLLPILRNLYAWTSESKQLEQICECPYSVTYQCSCLNSPLITILLTYQALTLSTYKTLIWKGCILLPPCSFNNSGKIFKQVKLPKYTVPFYLHNWQIMPGCVLYCVMHNGEPILQITQIFLSQ